MESTHIDLRPFASHKGARLTVGSVTYILDRPELERLAEMLVHTLAAVET